MWDEIVAERHRQDVRWGGPDHDDEHYPSDWVSYIKEHADKALNGNYRQRLIEVAALAVAAVESYDRRATPFAPVDKRGGTPTERED